MATLEARFVEWLHEPKGNDAIVAAAMADWLATERKAAACGGAFGVMIPRQGDHVELRCEGQTACGVVEMVWSGQRSLLVKLEQDIATPAGCYSSRIALLRGDDAEYHELVGGSMVKVVLKER